MTTTMKKNRENNIREKGIRKFGRIPSKATYVLFFWSEMTFHPLCIILEM